MPENPNQPKEYDAVLGGQNQPPMYGAVFGGIEGIKKRLASSILEVRINALTDALKYGEQGLDLVLQALQDESFKVQFAAYSLLKDRQEPTVKQQLDKVFPFFEFEVVTVDAFGLINSRCRHYARYFTEDLGNGASLEMVAIPGGTFLMGSPTTEVGRRHTEDPQHWVTVAPFFIGKYQITQAQWQAVAALPKINRDLQPNPYYFKEDNLPVEYVYWFDAVEFCARVSQKTQREYRLPSEAEWEYACRAGTTTTFHFGETITTDLANYNGKNNYGAAPKGTNRRETTPVGSFGVANNFGLYDMHGNVWELCADNWHDNYEDAPTNGSAWLIDGNDNRSHVLRGGAWGYAPHDCRSAFRHHRMGSILSHIGFRLVCAAV